MNEYIQLMDELKDTSVRLDKYTYEKAFNDISNFFSEFKYLKINGYPITQVERNFDFQEGKTRNLALEKIVGPKSIGSNIKLMYMRFYEEVDEGGDYPFMQEIQVDTHSRSKNSHKYKMFVRDNISGLYLMNDFLPENLEIPEERLFVVNK